MRKVTVSILLIGLTSSLALAGPTTLTYKATLLDAGGNPMPDGTYSMRFTLYSQPTSGTVLWAEEDASVQVTGGLFSTTFGDGIPLGNVFDFGVTLYLEVAIDLNHNGTLEPSEILLPRQLVVGAAWAMDADRLEGLGASDFARADHEHNWSSLKDIPAGLADSVGKTQTGDITAVIAGAGLTGGGIIGDVTLAVSFGARGTATSAARSDHYHTLAEAYDGAGAGAGRTLLANAGPVVIGGTGGLHVAGSIQATGFIQFMETLGGRTFAVLRSNGLGGGALYTYDERGTPTLILGSASVGDGGFMEIRMNSPTINGLLLDGWDGNSGMIAMYRRYGTSYRTGITLDADVGDSGSLLTMSDGTYTAISMDGRGVGGGAEVYLRNRKGVSSLLLDGDQGDSGSAVIMYDGRYQTVNLDANGSGGGADLYLRNSKGVLTAWLDADYLDDSRVVLYDDSGKTAIYLNSDSTASAPELSMYASNGTAETVQILGEKSSNTGAHMLLRRVAGQSTVELDTNGSGSSGEIDLYTSRSIETVTIQAAETSAQGAQILLRKADGTATIEIDADYNGDGRIITQELQITGGSDLSEQFDIRAAGGQVEPGMVVSIDPSRPGKLMVSTKPYDKTVAGIVSGAGGVKPGMLMGQAGSRADGMYPVALTGRVYCLCDASNGPIEPGDLLTTSNTAGHAMKATDHGKAQGAILGKAMTALPKGKGLVLVLVALQ